MGSNHLTATDFIGKKKRGEPHSFEELDFFIREFMQGNITDYQVTAWLMAVCLRGMTPEETWHLTEVLANSGQTFPRDDTALSLDKHSTGGVGDTTTLVVVPLLASLGQPMVKLSGRGLGHTGGTVDKLASIPGLKTQLARGDIQRILKATGMVIASQSEELAPADGLLYALRDVTATVDNPSLIAASIMAKKLALGTQALVLDVKAGRGALMPSWEQATKLADVMLHIARRSGIRARALITNMDQPLSSRVGNALEVEAALEVLSGGGNTRLRRLCVELSATLLVLANAVATREQGRHQARQQLDSGAGLHQFMKWVKEQGGQVTPDGEGIFLPTARIKQTLAAGRSGFVQRVDARKVGEAAVHVGAGRQRKGESLDPGAGFILEVEIGSQVRAGQPLAWILGDTPARLERAKHTLGQAFVIGEDNVNPPELVLARMD